MNLQEQALKAESSPRCVHCANLVPIARLGSAFCCDGCFTVHRWIEENGLGDYYVLKSGETARSGALRPGKPGLTSDQKISDYRFLDQLHLQNADVPVQLFLEGFHCLACLWLFEKLPLVLPDLERLDFDPSESIARVYLRQGGLPSRVASELERLGFKPHWIPEDRLGPAFAQAQATRLRERRMELTRLAVAGAAAGNIMMFSFAVYAGAEATWLKLFNVLSGLLYLPSFFFSGLPLFYEARRAWLARRLTVEIPLVFGIVLGSVWSYWELLREGDGIFFDSLSSLIFLLLASRLALKQVQSQAMRQAQLLHLLTPQQVRLSGGRGFVTMESLVPGEKIEVFAQEVIPVDGQIVEGSSHISRAAMNGEPDWVNVNAPQSVDAGTLNCDSTLVLEVRAVGYQTRLGRLVRLIESGSLRKPSVLKQLDRFTPIFIALVGLSAMGAFVTGGLVRAISMLIIVCPCGLALAGPLVFARSLARLAQLGVLVRSGESVEKLAHVDQVIFDKTGTLTSGQPGVSACLWDLERLRSLRLTSEALWPVVSALEEKSIHPVGRAVGNYARAQSHGASLAEVGSIQVLPGAGVQGVWRSLTVSVKALEKGSARRVGIWVGSDCVAQLTIQDFPVAESLKVLQDLRLGLAGRPLRLGILTGDRSLTEEQIREQFELQSDERVWISASPERKAAVMDEPAMRRTLWVGEGANDALALRGAFVSAASRGAVEIALRSADLYLGEGGVAAIPELLRTARRTLRTLYAAILFSLIYNVFAIFLVLMGKIAPWVAAGVMPLSAFSVYLISIVGIPRLRSEKVGQS